MLSTGRCRMQAKEDDATSEDKKEEAKTEEKTGESEEDAAAAAELKAVEEDAKELQKAVFKVSPRASAR